MGRKYTITRPSMFDLNTIIDIELDEDDVGVVQDIRMG